jgi:dTDP-4-dehydrorhamnose 3,5-epimerase
MDRVAIIKGIKTTPLKIIEGDNGNVMHALKCTDNDYVGFGEVYFSTINFETIKGWKKHTKMTSNLIVPNGEVQFVFYDDRDKSETKDCFVSINVSQKNYLRITVEPGLWMAFKGISREQNTVMNLASICHDPKEALNDPLEKSNKKYPL